ASSAASELQEASATVAKAAADMPTNPRRVGVKGKGRGVVIAVSSSGSLLHRGGAAGTGQPVLRDCRDRAGSAPLAGESEPPGSGHRVRCGRSSTTAIPDVESAALHERLCWRSCRDFRQPFVVAPNVAASVTQVKRFTEESAGQTPMQAENPMTWRDADTAPRTAPHPPPRGREHSCNSHWTGTESFEQHGGTPRV